MGILARQLARHARRDAVVLLLAVGALNGAGGCGGSTRESDGERPARTARPVPRTSHALADAVLLAASDMSTDWKSTSPTPPASCGRTGWEDASAESTSPSFRLRYRSVQQNVGVFATPETADSVFAALRTRRSQRCFFRSLLTGVTRNGGEGNISQPTVVLTEFERHSSDTRYRVTADSVFGRVSIYADQVRIQVGRVICVLVLVDVGQPIDEAIYERVVRLVRSRTREVADRASA